LHLNDIEMGPDIIFFAGIEWHGQNRMPCHHLVERLAKKHRIFYINNFGALRDLDHHDLSRCLSKVSGLFRGRSNPHLQVHDELSAVHVWQPWVIPTPRVPFLQRVNVSLLRRSLSELYQKYSIEAPIIWTRLPTPIVWEAVQGLERSLLVYQSIDKFPEHPRIAESLRERYRAVERMFNEQADVVFTSARGLCAEKREFNRNTHFIPNGVSESFATAKVIQIPKMESITGSVLGFAGALGTATDIEWIVRLARGMPDVTFVFLGTIDRTEPLQGLESLNNVILQGLVPHHELASWFQYFDIGLMPYKINAFQDYTFPSKLAEYLMAGLPIVATRLPELEYYQEVVKIADTPEAMMTDIRQLLESGSRSNSELLKQRKEVAVALTWESQIVKIEDVLEEALVH
jgi:glycosyltransferase involved in cell wall biosynthesis